MAKAPKFLITTDSERTWLFDKPVIFLGDWCLKYSRQQIWEKMDYEIAAPFGLNQPQRDKDLAEIKRMTSDLLKDITHALNELHGKSHSSNYWNIILGNWLVRYVSVCYNRYFTILNLLDSHEISSTSVFRYEKYTLVVPDTLKFITVVNQSTWNNFLYYKVLNSLGFTNFNFIDIDGDLAKSNFQIEDKHENINLKQFLKSTITRFLPFFSRESDALIMHTYLPREVEIKLQLRLLQMPQLRTIQKFQASSVDPQLRETFLLNSEDFEGFEKFIRDLIPEMIPACFLEGFELLELATKKTGWPSRPKFIFTSNNFDTDEVFKVWASEKVEQGVPYYIGQHGNNYGTSKLSRNYPEIQYSTRFISWGWSNKSSNVVPGFIFKVANKHKPFNSQGGLVLISNCVDHMLYAHDSTHEFKKFQIGQFNFVSGLDLHIQKQLTVRLHAAWRFTNWEDDIRWRDQFPKLPIDLGDTPIDLLLGRSRLAVHSYDSTGILEGLASNVPTLAFWEGDFEHLLPEAREHYEFLRLAGIIHLNAATASAHINEHWNDICGWWNSELVQQARISFCGKYAKNVSNPSKVLRQLLS